MLKLCDFRLNIVRVYAIRSKIGVGTVFNFHAHMVISNV